jgi:phospholipase A1
MKKRYFCQVGVWLMVTFSGAYASAIELAESLARCASIADDRVRLDCYDKLQEKLPPSKQAGRRSELQTKQSSGPEMTSARERYNEKIKGRWLGIQPYRRNYILPITYNDKVNDELFKSAESDFSIENVEIKFQLSFELPVWESILDQDIDLYFAYSQLSFFQAYNQQFSSPFRDTVYEPELGLNWRHAITFKGWRFESIRLALNHQSNGRTEPLSRSWNRLIGQFEVKKGNLSLGLRLWHRFQEDEEDDDNPDITEFMGNGELFAGYDHGPHRLGLMLRSPLEHGAIQIDWSRLLSERVRFYVQFFNGYGESLIDYDHRVSRLGLGFLLNEWP